MKLLISRPFTKDVQRLRDKKILSKISNVLNHLKTVNSLFQFPQLTEMVGYKGYYRIKLDYHYRLGIYVDGDTVQVLRVGTREGFYQIFPP
jgi:mRNA-degrading endonuclease RelE of RelBE toxin-antitoxin system